jgi:hypothetical protein
MISRISVVPSASFELAPKPNKTEIGLIVIRSIQQVENGGNNIVTVSQGTSLGASGLDHTPIQRKMYHQLIKNQLPAGWILKTLTPNKYVLPTLKDVGDIIKIVFEDIGKQPQVVIGTNT